MTHLFRRTPSQFAKEDVIRLLDSNLGHCDSAISLDGNGNKISSASICIHQPQRSITSHAEGFGTLIIENRRIARLTRQPAKRVSA